ncbi:aminotransferase class IV [Labilibaculum sp. K2S]|uniref:aminotransferase class IV n=1 Tax=Labilibaculum sp. K2S TaxID=3056386 RepID=UPI0025A4C411|nr:aminotransferase class IV [Labilibaculum sp. K2S]MDM8158787.1 aminotransferase class IV [Labilibaculum sp. K2S]
MNTTEKICLDGKLYPKDELLFGAGNRAFRYGDSLFETIHANGTEIQFLPEHLNRLTNGMDCLGMTIPHGFREKIKTDITFLIHKNKAFAGTRIRLSVFRKDGGLYTPTDNSISYLIETSPLDHDHYLLNRKGLKVGIYEEMRKSLNLTSRFKTGNSLPFILAANYRKKMNWDDCILLNDRGNIVESISSNLFLMKDGILMTPSNENGGVSGIMREQVIETAIDLNITVFDDCVLNPENLLVADEIFLTNAISGIQWVVAYQERRYFNKTAKLLIEELNRRAFNER